MSRGNRRPSPGGRRRGRWLSGLVVVLLLLGLWADAAPALGQGRPPTGAAVPAAVVDVEMRIANIFGFSSQDKTYNVQGTLWLEFSRQVRDELRRSGAQPIDMIHLQNRIHPWNASITPLGAITSEGADRFGQGYLFDGLFYSDRIDYGGYPFGTLRLGVILEPVQYLFGPAAAPIVLRGGRSEIGSQIGIDGYNLTSWSFGPIRRRSTSTIGSLKPVDADRLAFSIRYSSDRWASFVKWILPPAIVMMVMLLSPLIRSPLSGERLAIAPTVILTIVLMQQSYRDTLPKLPYLTFLDKFYALSYLISLAFFGLFIWSTWLESSHGFEPSQQRQRRFRRCSHALQLASLAAYALLALSHLSRI